MIILCTYTNETCSASPCQATRLAVRIYSRCLLPAQIQTGGTSSLVSAPLLAQLYMVSIYDK